MLLPYRTILVTTDLSPLGDAALPHALRLAKDHGAKLLLATVVETPPSPSPLYAHYYPTPSPQARKQARQDATKRLEALLAAVPHEGLDVETCVLEGEPQAEIVRTAREREVSLLVMSSHGRTGLRHLFLGSVAERVVRGTSCPVLLIR